MYLPKRSTLFVPLVASARRLTFTTTVASSELQVYTGHVLSSQPGSWSLAGTFEAFSGTGATATRNVHGWQALDYTVQRPGVVKQSATYTTLSPLSLSMIANAPKGTLTIASVDAQDNVTGTVFDNGIQGFWDGHQRKLTFIRFEDLADASHLQIYTGYLSSGFPTGVSWRPRQSATLRCGWISHVRSGRRCLRARSEYKSG